MSNPSTQGCMHGDVRLNHGFLCGFLDCVPHDGKQPSHQVVRSRATRVWVGNQVGGLVVQVRWAAWLGAWVGGLVDCWVHGLVDWCVG